MSSPSAQTAAASNPADQLLQLATGYMASACIGVAAQLKIADLLAGGPFPRGSVPVPALCGGSRQGLTPPENSFV